VAHHLIYRAIYGDIEKTFIHDSYSCRQNKDSLYGIKRATKFIRQATDNYQKQAFILKLDIQGYFMHIKHEVIYQKVLKILNKNKTYNESEISITTALTNRKQESSLANILATFVRYLTL
jgi:hypothetical protein